MATYRAVPTLNRDLLLLVLTWAAGCVDAISYLGLGHVFTAMMTGNTVLLGLALAQGEILAALRSIVALVGFAVGVVIGAVIVERDDGKQVWPRVVTVAFTLEATILAAFAATWSFTGPARGALSVHCLIVLLALAMGIQAAAVRRLGVPGIATTYITGTVTSLFVDLVVWNRSRVGGTSATGSSGEPVQWERRVGLLGGVFLVYGFGALAGGALQAHLPSATSVAPVIAVALVAAIASSRYRIRA